MSASFQTFEFILKKNSAKRPLGLYSDNKQQNKHNLKPQDVISSVSMQLKAIQNADSLKITKSVAKDLHRYKKSNFLSVNNLPMYEEVPKTTTKFDTQCVSDTQLINIIEDAEVIDVHRGMTQEFETTFIQHTEKHSLEAEDMEDDEKATDSIHTENTDKVVHEKEGMNKIHENTLTKAISINRIVTNIESDNSVSLISPIMCSNNVVDIDTSIKRQGSNDDENTTQIQEYSQIFHDCIEIADGTDIDRSIERPLSPIFMHKSIRTKSKSPSPLIFNLEKFERFEKIAIPILESNTLKTAKQVINSQILDKELHIQMDEDILLNERDVLSPVLQNKDDGNTCSPGKELKTHIVKDPNLETDLEFIELDKATSEELIDKIMNEDSKSLKVRPESEVLKDEILFSSDEEDNYLVHKSYQDLPFTCALETSFYDQSDVLDKTMYVGFQTASNKSIQIFTESFAQAKSILSGEITITDLVNNCDGSVKNKKDDNEETQAKMDLFDEEIEFNLAQKDEDHSEFPIERNEIEALDNGKAKTSNFEGFMTASRKVIKLSQKALARCKKVFQDIDLNDNFDTQIEEENVEKQAELNTDKIRVITDNLHTEVFVDEEIQSIDDEIIQEFENIEMSLKEDKEPDKNVSNFEFKSSNNKDTQDVLKVIDFDEDLTEIDIEETNIKGKNLPKTVEEQKLSKNVNEINLGGFKTASNKNIKISKEALAKTKNLFQDLCSTEFPTKTSRSIDKEYPNLITNEQPSTSNASFVGFKTASNKNIKISDEASAKVRNIFRDIDEMELPNKNSKEEKGNINEQNIYEQQPTSKNFVGFKTANNKDVNISKDALTKTKKIFEGIDSTEFILPIKNNTDPLEVYPEISESLIDFQPSTSKCNLGGFKTASNKNVKVSDVALAKTRDIFKDIDSADFKFPEKGNKINGGNINFAKVTETTMAKPKFEGLKTANYNEIIISETSLAKTKNIFKDLDSEFKLPKTVRQIGKIGNEFEIPDLNMPSTSTGIFGGFKTANNKKINVSKEALAKMKNIFQDIDEPNFKLPEKGDNLNINKPEDFPQLPSSVPSFMGFKTANNKKIAISKESLAKTNNSFKDIYERDLNFTEKVNRKDDKSSFEATDLNQPSTSKASFVGFQTANNKKIHISEESLAKSKDIFKDFDSNDLAYQIKPEKDLQDTVKAVKSPYPNIKASTSSTSFVGFKTANNKVIQVSETALVKSKNVFKDIDATELTKTEKVKDDYPNIEIDDVESNISNVVEPIATQLNDFQIPGKAVPMFQGFQTASNKQVKVSAEALANSRKMFQNIDVSQDNNIKSFRDVNIDPLHAYKGIQNVTEESNTDDLPFKGKSSLVFKGFKTANKKPVKISEEAIAKSRKLLQDIETIVDDPEPEFRGFNEKVEISQKALLETKKMFEDVIKRTSQQGFQTSRDEKTEITASTHKFSFKTGSNRDIKISEEAIARTKRRFSEIDDSNEYITNIKKDKVTNEENIANIIDTQVLNNFDESLHTEDFHDSPVTSKRSGSPILSCPRAKRRKKFETPYSQKIPQTVKTKEIIKTTKDSNKIVFTENYKKNKKFTLKYLAELTKGNTAKIDPYLLKFTFDNFLEFEFRENRNEISKAKITVNFLKELFLNSVNSQIVPNGWLDNHIKLILWKLISYEVKFKLRTVTARNVIDQLKYRYDKELYNAQRPALRKILEKDDVASKALVLCVAKIYADGVGVDSPTTTNNIELLLTDGWYCLKATIDKMLAQLVCQGKIVVGSKIVTNGAELVNCEQGVSPWEDTSAVRLKLFGNSTRRARWDARLGYQGNGAILSQLSSVKLDGGKVSKLRVFVARVYPALYVEKFEDGSTVTRSERLEYLHQNKSEAERQAIMEKIYEEVEKEFSDQESQDPEGLTGWSSKRTCLDSGSQIAKVMKRSKDPAEFQAGLTSSQTRLLESHTAKHRELLLQKIQQKIREKIEKAGVCVDRNVVTLLKIRVAGVRSGGEVTKGMMSIWKPPEAVMEIIKEGCWIDVMNVVPTAVRYSEIQISAGRQSVFSTSKYKDLVNTKSYTKSLERICFTIKDLSHNPLMTTDYNEIDTVGFIFLVDPSIREFDSTKQPFQNVFLADADKNMICVNFWGGLKKFGYHNVLDTGQIVYCSNLQKRAGNTRKSIPQYRVTEFSYFTKTPKNINARVLVDGLSKKFLSLDRRKFCEDCVVLKNNYAVIKINNENVSPYRFNNSDVNLSKNKIFIDSPLAKLNKMEDNFNLTGLDFESTFKQTDTQNLSEEVLQRKKKVNEKIARLKMYGEPPPLSTIHIINKSKNASNSYKSPNNSSKTKIVCQKSKSAGDMSKCESSANVARVRETPENCGNLDDSDVVCSPVLMNRTYVWKSVYPVKIDFDMKDNNDSNVDHFAEEFDGSPPLSLD